MLAFNLNIIFHKIVINKNWRDTQFDGNCFPIIKSIRYVSDCGQQYVEGYTTFVENNSIDMEVVKFHLLSRNK